MQKGSSKFKEKQKIRKNSNFYFLHLSQKKVAATRREMPMSSRHGNSFWEESHPCPSLRKSRDKRRVLNCTLIYCSICWQISRRDKKVPSWSHSCVRYSFCALLLAVKTASACNYNLFLRIYLSEKFVWHKKDRKSGRSLNLFVLSISERKSEDSGQ